VICEKPMTGTAAETEALLGEARGRGRVLVESRNLLFNDVAIAIDRLVKDGRLRAIREVDVLLSLDLTAGPFGDLNLTGPGVQLPGGAVHDFLPHLAYLFLHFGGDPAQVDRVAGFLENRSGNARVGYDHLDALIEAGEVRGRLRIASDVEPPAFRLVVRGTRGSVETDFYNPFLRIEGAPNIGKRAPLEQIGSGLKLARAGVRNFFDKVRQHGTYHGMPRMLDAIYAALQAGEEPPIAEWDMIATARLVDRIVELGGAR
jgi:predicted dehydrogenase